MIPAADLPRWSGGAAGPARCIAAIDDWVARLLGCGIVEAFGTAAPRASGAAALEFLDDFSARNWDFRAGRERNLAEEPLLTPEQVAAVRAAVGPLGLDGTPAPRRARYDSVLMTGGMVRAGIVKPRYLRELSDAGLGFDEAVFLGAFRPFAGDEARVAKLLGVGGSDEVDAMAAGLEQAFGPLQEPVVREYSGGSRNASWREESWDVGGRMLRVIAAPSSDPLTRRANTADTFRFWAASRKPTPGSVLVITTPVYVPYQGAIAVEVLGLEFGLEVETVATSASANDLGELSQEFAPHHQLQELRSAIVGLRSLRSKLDAGQRR
jgi:hypothetical protein